VVNILPTLLRDARTARVSSKENPGDWCHWDGCSMMSAADSWKVTKAFNVVRKHIFIEQYNGIDDNSTISDSINGHRK
jgi:hypothetical protein